ncbi:MAG: Cobalamin synthase [Methanomicrobiales archaeon 53_19]|jgi:adenosylcobinamide-GDP ribazoletransferase|uniref:adenosylcobinamide-GDP ribazoletransferase n=1 Tax=Methanocalculus sp. TaxID=2004547 RepID=UPI000749CEB4|nr:adenosylcobinamide-GDP ribazoletransferase [Methanocalculus sp.]KUK70050.1 MAG: Cobalamin synthase [Methanocalculus sp. 52_23]KUL04397.1 MAG: Cobalamin synthase [Methanomicrobiales archaeon 53_19]HIJ07021.1 adenosylcobinamide-GDP ribazoletransferase [Methanocalculus sp.]
MSLFEGIRALIQFTTIIPIGRSADFDAFATRSYLYPVAGYLIGGLAAIPLLFIPHPLAAAAVALGLLLLLSGCNHFDGLLDLGDGLMAHGSREVRIRALTDRQVGAGGVALGLSITLISFGALASLSIIPIAVLIAEVAAKASMASLTSIGRPFRKGIHSYLFWRSRPSFVVIAWALTLPLFLLPIPPIAVASALFGASATTLILLFSGERLFGGINGDLVGAANEIVRAVVFLSLLIAL